MALKTVSERRTGTRETYSGGGGDGADWRATGTETYEYDVVTGWTSEETGQFYSLAPDGLEQQVGEAGISRLTSNVDYLNQRAQAVRQLDWDYQLNQERAQIEAQNQAQRAQWQAQLQAQADAFNQQQAEYQRAAQEQQRQFEAERLAREQERVAAELAKKEKLAAEAKISSETMLGDMQRVAAVKENDLVAAEDKRTLSVDDKAQLFSPGQQSEQEQQKTKQSFLEKILSTGVTGAPKQ